MADLNEKTAAYDVVISGGGPVGASLAVALSGSGLKVALIERAAAGQVAGGGRVLAMSYASRRLFDALAIWPELSSPATAIRHIHISEQGGFGFTRLHANDVGVPALGYVTRAGHLGAAITTALGSCGDVDVHYQAEVSGYTLQGDSVAVALTLADGAASLRTRLLVAADGGQSLVRRRAGIGVAEKDYRQCAVVAEVEHADAHQGWAFERFTNSGPMALLPLEDKRSALVWTTPADGIDALLELDDARFLASLQQRFGRRLGRFEALTPRLHFPLKLQRSRQLAAPRVAVIGNAAQMLHPVAGQGLNLGLRDVATLAELLRGASDPGDAALLAAYSKARAGDRHRVVAFSDALVELFTPAIAPLYLGRNLGLGALDMLPGPRRLFSRFAMGLSGRVPPLLLGRR